MHDLATIQRMNREAVEAHERAMATITESVTEADEVAEAEAKAAHKACGKPVTFDREHISDGNVEDYPEAQHGHYYAAACLHCDEDLMEFEIEYPQPTQDERAEAMKRHPAGKGKRLTEPAIDPATEPEQDEPEQDEPEQDESDSGERTTKPLKPAEVAHLASASAHELARKVLAGFTKNGEIPFALSGQAALDIIAVAIEADRAQRAADLETLADAASKWATELTDYVIPESANDGLREYMAERDEIQAALGRYLGEKEAGK